MAGMKKQGYKARQDESLGARMGARSKLKRKVSKVGRRGMASGPRKAAGGSKYGLRPGVSLSPNTPLRRTKR